MQADLIASPFLIIIDYAQVEVGKAQRRSIMVQFDDEDPRPKRTHEIGQDLSLLSVDELRERIELLKAEMARLQAEINAKGSTLQAAEALFRR